MKAAISPATPPIPPAIAMIGMQTPSVAGWRGEEARFAGPRSATRSSTRRSISFSIRSRKPAISSSSWRRAELLPGRERRLQLLPRDRFHAGTVAPIAGAGKASSDLI